MTDDTKRRPGLRLAKDFAFFDQDGSHLWRSFRAGALVTDPRDIEWLTALGAPVIEIDPSPHPIPQIQRS